MARLKGQDAAQALALAGHIEDAEIALHRLLDLGQSSAHASLAEIAAYRGQWRLVFEHAQHMLVHPQTVATRNVYVDMAALLARCGPQLEAWHDVRRIATIAVKQLHDSTLQRAYGNTAARLLTYAQSEGAHSDELRLTASAKAALDARRHAYRVDLNAMQAHAAAAASQDPIQAQFALAYIHRVSAEAVALFDRTQVAPHLFHTAAFLAEALMRDGREDDAWTLLQAVLPRWWPVENTQVAPVELVTEHGLDALMTPERRIDVLRTPRGPQASP
ncbi:MAG: hypothetical protein LCH73_00760 [Proteobacteria bacterium]|nr:hypothetical protein [Pseudomonadota bacterium]